MAFPSYSREQLARQISFTQITQEDLRLLVEYRDRFLQRVPQMVDEFYAHLETVPELRAVVSRHSSIDRLKQTLAEYLSWLVRGKVDQEYADFRLRIGAVHDRIGLVPQWYLGMFHIFFRNIVALVEAQPVSAEERQRAIMAFLKLLTLDMQLAVDAYIHKYLERNSKLERLQAVRLTMAESGQELAAMAEEFSASAEEMAASVIQVAADAGAVAQQTDDIRTSAGEGARRIHQAAETIRQAAGQIAAMQTTVDRLAESSRKMESILRTVEGIAQQTNLLSLNAAIEAARAGQYGRGFAVVADEVRKLSDRTSVSLKEISRLIADSGTAVAQVRQNTAAVEAIVSAGVTEAGAAHQEFSAIARLVAEGAAGVAAINESMHNLSLMSTSVQAGAEQNARLATTLSAMATQDG